MAIGHGANYETPTPIGTNPITVAANPATAPKGALVLIAHGQVSTDLVSGVTYGGVAMTRKASVADTTGTNPFQVGRSYIYALEGGVPPGAQNIVVTRTGTALIWVGVWTQTGNQNMEVISTATAAAVADPSVALTRSGRASLGYAVLFSGAGTPAGIGSPGGWSRGPDHLFPSSPSDYSAAVFREQVSSTADGTYVFAQVSANSALCGIIVAEVVPAPPPAGASDHNCGAECGITAPDILAGATAHWNLGGTTPPTSQTGEARHGGRAYLFEANGTTSYLGHTKIAGGTQRWERFYVRFKGALPSSNCTIYRLGIAVGDAPGIGFRVATGDIVGKFGSFLAPTTPHPVVPDRWYRVETLADISANPCTIKLRVCEASQADPLADGASLDRGTGSHAQAASTFTDFRIGASTLGTTIAKVVIDDHLTGFGTASHPAGPSTSVPSWPASDGTHVYNAAGDFRDALADLGLATTTAWTRLGGLLVDDASLLHAAGAATGEYLEILAGGIPAMSSIRSLEMVSVHSGATVNAHRQTLRWLEDAGVVDVFTDADFSESSLIQHSRHYLVMPDGDPLTVARLNASKWRYASSFTAAIGGGQISGLMMEIDGVLTGTPPPPPGSGEGNPIHVFPAPGTYTVTLTVTDDSGLTDTDVQEVVTVGGVTTSLQTVELREGGTLRATRSFVPGDTLGTFQFVLTGGEISSIGNWNNLEGWFYATGGTRAIRITRCRLLLAGVAPPTPSLLTAELRESGTLRATRSVQPGETIGTHSFALTAGEIASVGNWDNVEGWVYASGGARAIRVTRFRVLTP